jgi:hypothetical protein
MSGLRSRRRGRRRKRDGGQQGEGIEDLADPEAVSESLGEDEEDVGWGEAGIAVGVEEVVEVGKEVGTNDEDVIAEPDCGGEGGGGEAEAKEGAKAVSGARPEEPEDRGEKEDGGGLGEDHERDEQA